MSGSKVRQNWSVKAASFIYWSGPVVTRACFEALVTVTRSTLLQVPFLLSLGHQKTQCNQFFDLYEDLSVTHQSEWNMSEIEWNMSPIGCGEKGG